MPPANGGQVHTISTGTQRLLAHRSCQSHLCELRTCAEIRRQDQLRFDDTNPEKESVEYVNAIREDIAWLGFEWNGGEFYTSDYFQQLFDYACNLIGKGLAYVDDQSAEQIASQKGAPGTPGTNSPFRERTPEENLRLFEEMKVGQCQEGERVLRAKIDMAHDNMLLRDPVIYRVKFVEHHRTGNDWVIYPMYDFAHGQSDSIERISHSLCSLEFENHRPLYNWFIRALDIYPSEQTKLQFELHHHVERKLLRLVEEGVVDVRMTPACRLFRIAKARVHSGEHSVFADRIGVAGATTSM